MNTLPNTIRPHSRNGTAGPAFHDRLRSLTASAHARVDSAYGAYDLGEWGPYSDFLRAHFRVLAALEPHLYPRELGIAPRLPAITADLENLGCRLSEATAFDLPDDPAARWGALYVLEGSRLGGGTLLARVPDHLPRAYLSATHPPGGWRVFRHRLDAEAEAHGALWERAAVASALRVFDAFAASAEN